MKKGKKFMGRLIRFYACALTVVLGTGNAQGELNTILAPRMNPEFVRWQKNRQAMKESDDTPQNRNATRLLSAPAGEEDQTLLAVPGGLIPTVIDFSYLNSLNSTEVRGEPGYAIPKYDPRTSFTLTPIRHQDPQDTGIGTCWAQASICSMETWLALNNYGQNQFSVRNMVNLEGWDSDSWNGGNFIRAAAYLLRWNGPVWESQDPYTNSQGVVRHSASSTVLPPVFHVQQTRLVPARTGPLDNDSLKKAILEFGGLYATMLLYSPYYKGTRTLIPYWNNNGAYYCNKTGAGHAVTVIGWDDSYGKENFNEQCRPKGNGAWIVRDSYGDALPRDNGYIYISYYDTTFAYTTSCAFPMLEDVGNYGRLYQYDPLGQVESWGIPASSTQIYTSGWAANMFTAVDSDELAAVGLYFPIPNARYTIVVRTGCTSGNPSSGSKVVEQSGITGDWAGYYTIPLETMPGLIAGQRFTVAVWLSTPNAAPFSIEKALDGYTSEASANAGESFFSMDGTTWYDLYENVPGTANFCCKAYTKSPTVGKPALSSIAISGVSSLASGQSAQFTCEAMYSDGSKKSISPTWSIYSGGAYATITSTGVVTAKSVSAQQIVTVKATYTEDGVVKTATWSFYVTVTAPGAPTGVEATAGTESACTRVSWTAPSGATSYAVYRGTRSGSNYAQFLETVTATRYNDSSATPGVNYWYYIKAKNSSGTSVFSSGAQGWRRLSPPTSVTATDDLLDKVSVSWNDIDGAKYYRVYRATSVGGTKYAIGSWQTSTSFDDATATAGVTYHYFVVAAVDASGSRPSDYSIAEEGKRAEPVSVASIAINGASCIASGGNATYSATATYTDGHTRTVSPAWSITSGSSHASVSGNRVTAATVTANQSVTLKASYTEGGKTVTGTKAITISAAMPSAPQNLTATASLSSQTVTLAWSAVDRAASYKVYRGGEAIGVASSTTYTDRTATPGVTYAYTVSAVNGGGESAKSSAVAATVPLAMPTGVTATSNHTDGVQVSWPTVNGATCYRVARATSATGAKTELGAWQNGRTYNDTSAVSGTAYWYFVKAATSSSGANASAYSSGTPGRRIALTSISLTGPERLMSSKAAVYSCAATYSDGTTKPVTPSWSVLPSSAAAIDANGKLTAKAVTANTTARITASFTDGATKTATKDVTIAAPITVTAAITDVDVTSRWPFSPLIDIDYTLVMTPATARAVVTAFGRDEDHGVDMTATTLTGDGADGSYIAAGRHRLTWDIRADYNDFHAKAFNVSLTATPSAVGVPADVMSSGYAPGVALTWKEVDGSAGYEVWRSTGSTIGSAEIASIVTSGTSYYDTTGAAGMTYYYWIRAYTDYGYGEFSQPVTGTRDVAANRIYCVIDLSAGTNTSSYPVTYMDAPPSGGFNTDEYKTTKLVLRRIDPGSFKMGGTYDVTLTKAFYCGVFEVTQRQYELVTGSKPSYFKNADYYATRPVENVSWNMIRGDSSTYDWPMSADVDPSTFMGRLQAKTGLNLDLPTEAQWEYACRAGTTSPYNNGGSSESDLTQLGRYGDNSGYYAGEGFTPSSTTANGTATVGSYRPNAWGLYDMHGNVQEWCLDWSGSLASGVTDPEGPSSGTYRMLRGGSWNLSTNHCTSAFRNNWDQSFAHVSCGFRVARTLEPSPMYCVIDLSGGTNATSYPVTYMDVPPSGGFNTDKYKTTKLVLRRIDPGSFKMGGTYDVTLTKAFYCGVFEVTQRQYELVTGSKPSYFKNADYYATRPVENVSWNMIRGDSSTYDWPISADIDPSTFMGMLQAKTGLNLDLPTEAQWEYACRAGTTSSYNNGGSSESDLTQLGRYGDNSGYYAGEGFTPSSTTANGTATVGSYRPNAWGLYDMHGNVQEWCLDWYERLTSGMTDPEGPSSGTYRMLRGGSWNLSTNHCTSAFRNNWEPSISHVSCGFRLFRTLETSYVIRFNANGGVGTMADMAIEIDETKSLSANAFVLSGYTFAGWATSANGNVVYSNGQSVSNLAAKVGARVNLYAKWTANTYAIRFNANGGSGTMPDLPMTYDVSRNLTDNGFTKIGNTFAGWATNADGNVAYANGTSVKNLSSDQGAVVNLFAVWTANSYTVTLDMQGGTGGTPSVTTTYGSAMPSITVPTLSGYTFGGYWTGTSGSGTQYYTASGASARTWDKTSATKLFAKWTENGTAHDKVQLWEGGPYWATTNIGAENPWECGYYFWWGDTVGYKRINDAWVASNGSSYNFSFGPVNTPTYSKDIATLKSEGWITADNVLAPKYDAAQVQWGGEWRMPTDQEVAALIINCDWTWTTMNGVNGCVVRGKGDFASVSIFLPAVGYGYGTSLLYSGSNGHYWSSVSGPYTDDSCYSREFFFHSDNRYTHSGLRDRGNPIRPVQGAPETANSYTVTLDMQGGTGGTPSVTATYGSAMPPITVPTLSGYTFGGYWTGTNGNGTQYYTALGASARTWDKTSATKLYAKWTANGTAHDKVQLWAGGPYWATTNIGAENPWEYGDYFWWGDTVGYRRESNAWMANDGSSSNFSFDSGNALTYNNAPDTLMSKGWITTDGVLVPEHDAAHVQWGGGWRMPTVQEQNDLKNNCDWTWTTMNGVNGYVVRGKGDYASVSIFLPCAGYGYGASREYAGSDGYYWASAPDSDNYRAYELYFNSSILYSNYYGSRFFGQSVRPVQDAHWTENTYTVTLDMQGGTGGTPSVMATYGSAMPSITVPTLSGYTFGGYWTGTSGSGTQYYTALGMSARTWDKTSATKLYAKWTVNGTSHDKVQLWAGGPYWATTNIGAENPWECGYYFWWGGTIGYKRINDTWVASNGSLSTFSFSAANTPTYGKDIDTLKSEGWITANNVLAPYHDAAHVQWGGRWRMPTEQEQSDLQIRCDWIWTTINDVNGYVVRGKGDYASASIFIPCTGFSYGFLLYYSDSYGYYWSSVPRSDVSDYSKALYFYSRSHYTHDGYRCNGLPVRPVQGFAE